MTVARGREARLRKEHAEFYPGIEPGIWIPVEKLLRYVTDLIHRDPSKSGIITGRRLLREEHFDYRGATPRPPGLPEHASRLSDAGAAPPDRREGVE